MRSFVDLLSLNKEDVFEIFHLADKIQEGKFKDFLNGKSIVLFFPNTSIRTRVTFEKGIKDKYLFCGKAGNIGFSWKEAANVIGFNLVQCCPKGYEMEGIQVFRDIKEAVKGKDIICTDSLPANIQGDFEHYQITKDIMDMANENAILNPCPPFYRGEEN